MIEKIRKPRSDKSSTMTLKARNSDVHCTTTTTSLVVVMPLNSKSSGIEVGASYTDYCNNTED